MRVPFAFVIVSLMLAGCAPRYSWTPQGNSISEQWIPTGQGGPGNIDMQAVAQNAQNAARYQNAMQALVNSSQGQWQPNQMDVANNIQSMQRYQNAMQALVNNYGPQAAAPEAWEAAQRNYVLQQSMPAQIQDAEPGRQPFGANVSDGLTVDAVQPGDVADRAGIMPGDTILVYGGYPMNSPRDLQNAVDATQPGETKNIEILRNGREMTVAASF